jgi:hypothetical protein
MSQHLNEEQLQQYAEQSAAFTAIENLHLAQCVECQVKAANYRLLFQELTAMPQPAFDFDLEQLVLNALPAAQQTEAIKTLEESKTYTWIPAIAACMGICLVALTIILYAGKLASLFSGLSSTWIWMAIMPAAVLLQLQLVVLTKEYNRKMKLLNSFSK